MLPFSYLLQILLQLFLDHLSVYNTLIIFIIIYLNSRSLLDFTGLSSSHQNLFIQDKCKLYQTILPSYPTSFALQLDLVINLLLLEYISHVLAKNQYTNPKTPDAVANTFNKDSFMSKVHQFLTTISIQPSKSNHAE